MAALRSARPEPALGRERERARDENPAQLKLTARCAHCRQINVVTAADYAGAAG